MSSEFTREGYLERLEEIAELVRESREYERKALKARKKVEDYESKARQARMWAGHYVDELDRGEN